MRSKRAIAFKCFDTFSDKEILSRRMSRRIRVTAARKIAEELGTASLWEHMNTINVYLCQYRRRLRETSKHTQSTPEILAQALYPAVEGATTALLGRLSISDRFKVRPGRGSGMATYCRYNRYTREGVLNFGTLMIAATLARDVSTHHTEAFKYGWTEKFGDNPIDHLVYLICHEVSHAAVFAVFGKKSRPHGSRFQATLKACVEGFYSLVRDELVERSGCLVTDAFFQFLIGEAKLEGFSQQYRQAATRRFLSRRGGEELVV